MPLPAGAGGLGKGRASVLKGRGTCGLKPGWRLQAAQNLAGR